MNYGSSKSAKIVLSRSFSDVKNQLNFSKKKDGRYSDPKARNGYISLNRPKKSAEKKETEMNYNSQVPK